MFTLGIFVNFAAIMFGYYSIVEMLREKERLSFITAIACYLTYVLAFLLVALSGVATNAMISSMVFIALILCIHFLTVLYFYIKTLRNEKDIELDLKDLLGEEDL